MIKRAIAAVAVAAACCAFAVPAAASAFPHARALTSTTWAGYAGLPRKGQTIDYASVNFTVPAVRCSRSVGSGKHGYYAAIWAGIDGYTKASRSAKTGTLEQAGIVAYCATRKSAPFYYAFTQMVPEPLRHSHMTIHAGDKMVVYVASDNTGLYELQVDDLSRRGYYDRDVHCPAHRTCRGSSAEVITEAPSGGPDQGHGLVDMGTVRYTNAWAGWRTSSGGASGGPVGQLKYLTRITMSPKGHRGIVSPGRLTDRALPSAFSTYWKP